MADKKISQLSGATTPLAGNELIELVQGGTNVQATTQDVADLVDLTTIQSDIATLQTDVSNNTTDIATLQTSKQDNITLTTTGTSGAATLVGSTLNIPDYSAATGGGISFATASGTDTYTATITGVTSYVDGDAYLIRFTNGNTSSATLNINSLGAIALYKNNDGAMIGGDIWSGGEMLCVYDSTLTAFKCIGTSPNSIFAYVTNDDSVTITKGQVVYAFSGTGDRMTVKLANNTADATSAKTVGVVYSTSIAANQKGIIILQGLLDGLSILPTSTYADGDSIYLGATNGAITNVKPYAPNHLVYVATVTTASAGSSGRMYVRIQNGYELDELHNVQAQSPTLKDTLWYDNTVTPAQWKTASISTILGYTPASYTPRVQAVVSASTVTPTENDDIVVITAQAAPLTLANPTGVWVQGQALMIRIKDDGTSRTIGYGAGYRAIGLTRPTATVINKTIYLGIVYNSTDSTWDIIGYNQQA